MSNEKIVVRLGKPLLEVRFATIKTITAIFYLLLIIVVIFSMRMFVSSVQIRGHLGYFINMVSNGDGDILPSLQALPVFVFLIFDLIMALLIFRAFDPNKRPTLNRFMFILILLSFVFIIVVFALIISVIAHIYSEHGSLHDGIVTAMRNYSNNLKMKMQIDELQIEFQCCGSRKYDEWYNIKWYDSSLFKTFKKKKEIETSTLPATTTAILEPSDGDTPFSCCSMKSLTPCIHHNIEITGKSYLYTPEYNLSISTRGCYDILRETKQSVGWIIVGNLCLLITLEICAVSMFRFLQTAHFLNSKFDGHSRNYTIWLFGCYTGRIRETNKRPEIPPFPDDLKR